MNNKRSSGRPKRDAHGLFLDSKERIIRSAIPLFQEKGYSGIVVRDVLEVSQITQPTLYHHFKGLKGLYKAVVIHVLEEMSGEMKRATLAPTFEDQLIQLLTVFYQHRRSNVGAMLHAMTVHDEFSIEDLQTVGAVVNEGWRETVERMVKNAIRRHEIRKGNVTFLTQSTIEIGLSFSRSPLGNWTGWSEERQISEVAKLLLSGFGTVLHTDSI